jgi:hypothetical protein
MRERRNQEKSFRIAGVLAEIQTEHLQNTRLQHYL